MRPEKTRAELLKYAQSVYGTELSDAMLLFEYVSGIPVQQIRLQSQQAVSTELEAQFIHLLELRNQHIPVQHITGRQNFMGMELSVTKDVLIPRPETELLAERVIHACEGKEVLDLCTGSGCIAIAVKTLGKPKRVAASDLSTAALTVAKANATEQRAEIEWYQGDLFAAFSEKVRNEACGMQTEFTGYDIIVSNPPYIPTKDICSLMPEVRDYEPHLALDGAADGLLFYRRIAAECKDYLKPNGKVFLEIGCEQGEAVRAIFLEAGFSRVKVYKDYSRLDRIIEADNISDSQESVPETSANIVGVENNV